MTVFVAVTKQVPTRAIEGTEVQFVTVSPRKFFGFQTYEVYDRSVAISTSEKTVVDCVDRPDLCGGVTELTRIVSFIPTTERWTPSASHNRHRARQPRSRATPAAVPRSAPLGRGALCSA